MTAGVAQSFAQREASSCTHMLCVERSGCRSRSFAPGRARHYVQGRGGACLGAEGGLGEVIQGGCVLSPARRHLGGLLGAHLPLQLPHQRQRGRQPRLVVRRRRQHRRPQLPPAAPAVPASHPCSLTRRLTPPRDPHPHVRQHSQPRRRDAMSPQKSDVLADEAEGHGRADVFVCRLDPVLSATSCIAPNATAPGLSAAVSKHAPPEVSGMTWRHACRTLQDASCARGAAIPVHWGVCH